MKCVRYLLFFTSILLFSCNSQPEPTTLDVFVYVDGNINEIVPIVDADVFLVPGKYQTKTGSDGHAHLSISKPGSYELYGYKQGVGAYKTLIDYVEGSDQTYPMHLQSGVIPSCIPTIQLISPTLPANLGSGDSIAFSFKVTDIDTDPKDIVLSITSSKDGLIATGHPDTNHYMNYIGRLSNGIHTISVEGIDDRMLRSNIQFVVSSIYPSAIHMDTVFKEQGFIQVKWKKYIGESFSSYTVCRTEDTTRAGVAIKTFTNVDSVCYTDLLPPIKSKAWYFVQVINRMGMIRTSKFVEVSNPGGTIYNMRPWLAIHHPSLPIVYVYDDNQQKLVAINHETNETLATYNLTTRTNDLAIDDNGFGMEVYVPTQDGGLLILDALTLVKKKTISIGMSPCAVASNGRGFLFLIAGYGNWAPNPARTYSRSTGALLGQSKSSGLFGGEKIRLVPGTHSIIAVATSGSPIIRNYVEFNYRGEYVSENASIWDDGYGLDGSNFKISPNGKYMVSSSVGAIYGTTSEVAYLGKLEPRGLNLVDYAFSSDGNTIYAGTWDKNSIQVFQYPSLKFTKEYLTKGLPRFVFPFKGDLITVSLQDNSYTCFVFEKIKIQP